MPAREQLYVYAMHLDDHNQQRCATLERELGDLKTQVAQKQALLDALSFSHQRLANFEFKLGADYQCPRCWIMNEKRASLIPIGGGTSAEDFFRCRDCDENFSIPTGH